MCGSAVSGPVCHSMSPKAAPRVGPSIAQSASEFSFADPCGRQQAAVPGSRIDRLSDQFSQMRVGMDPSYHGAFDQLVAQHRASMNRGVNDANLANEGFQLPSFANQGSHTASSPPQGLPMTSPQLLNYRESDTIKIPPLPESVSLMQSWGMSVSNAVLAASGSHDRNRVLRWLHECRQKVGNPDMFFHPANTPPELTSLEAKLSQALREVVKSCSDPCMKDRIIREDTIRWDRCEEGWGGRRLLYEIFQRNELSTEDLHRHSLSSFWNMSWYGDTPAQVEEFRDSMRLVIQAALKHGLHPSAITDRLAKLMSDSTAIGPIFMAYKMSCTMKGESMKWEMLIELLSQWLDEQHRQSLNAKSVPFGQKPPPPAPGRERRNQRKDQPNPAGPAIQEEPWFVPVLRQFTGCRKHLSGSCTTKNCRYPHVQLPPAERERVLAAHQAKRKADGKPELDTVSSAASSVGGDTPRKRAREVGLCNAWQRGETCPRMPKCSWRHGDSPEEYARVEKLRAETRWGQKPASMPTIVAGIAQMLPPPRA